MNSQQVAIVTGSTSGIGQGIAHRLHAEGFAVLVNGFCTEEAGRQMVAALSSSADYIDADVSDSYQAKSIVDRALERFGRLDLLVNNAGIAKRVPHHDLDAVSDEFWDQIMAVNLRGPWNMIKAARNALSEAHGQVVNIASISGTTTTGSSIPYAVSKAGVIHLTRLLAKALGPDIRVNGIAPAYIDTPLTHEWTDLRERVIGQAPARRLGAPADVAAAVAALLDLGYVTGEIINVDGGFRL
ncbi:SDR family NAD(P)-dependent oxidoreductase [Brevibacterium sp. UBA7493]|uniref:SDR family NAD(P)-dependent oxidoreductase n=1 Tax=Brevibacterium sp. UBA7493 TaxID=1946121 RepID=UPI00257CA927|nr:SDR family oxidoreductase [Brevibacterium sp. UBA7493]